MCVVRFDERTKSNSRTVVVLQDFGDAHRGQHNRRIERRFDRDDVDIRHAKDRRARVRLVGPVGSVVFDVRVRTDCQRDTLTHVGRTGLRAGVPYWIPEFGKPSNIYAY